MPIVSDTAASATLAGSQGRTAARVRSCSRLIDTAALRAADVVLVDTEEHRLALPARHQPRAVVVLVGAPDGVVRRGRPRARGKGQTGGHPAD